MDFTWTPEQDAYRMDVRRWLEENRPQALARGEDPDAGGDDAAWQRLKEWHKKLYHAGWAGLTGPKEYGGPRPALHGAGHLSAGPRPPHPADGMQRARRHHDRAGTDAVGDRRAEETLPESDSRRRRDLVRGNVGAGRGLGPRVDPVPRRAQGRRVRRQRAEGVDHDRASRRLRAAVRAHRSRRAQAQGDERVAGRYEIARRQRPSAAANHRRQRVQRDLFRGRARAQGKPARPDEHGMAGAGRDADA